MTKSRFNRSYLTLVLVLLTIAFLHNAPQGLNPTAGARSMPAVADLTAEKQALSSFDTNLTNLEIKVRSLLTKSTITSVDLNSTKSSATALKTNVSQVQQTFQSVINKLKASGEWDNFDAATLRQITDPEARSRITTAGGAKKILLDAASQLSGLTTEIDALVQPLNSRVASSGLSPVFRGATGFMPAGASFVAASGGATPVVFKESFKCRFRSGIFVIRHGEGNSYKNMQCACDPTPASDCTNATS